MSAINPLIKTIRAAMQTRKLIKLLVLLIASSPLQLLFAYEQEDIETAPGFSISTMQFKGDGEHLLVWLPSERGMRGEYQSVALDLAALGFDVWALDLHGSYMVPESRSSLDEFNLNEILPILDEAKNRGFERLTFIAASRGAVLALELAALWDKTSPDSDFLKGHVFFTPHLLEGSPRAGEQARYKTIAKSAVLPIYLIQAEYSTKYARTTEITEVLAKGGSQVFTQKLKGVSGGYYARPEIDLSAADLEAKAKLATNIERSLKLMGTLKVAKRKQITQPTDNNVPHSAVFSGKNLKPYGGKQFKNKLSLESLYGGQKSLESYQGKVVLLNFWATWCRPCAKEIPSLSRLVETLKSTDFEVVTINIGEEAKHIQAFITDLPVNFEILLDKESAAVREWNVYAYPTNYLLDRSGKITHAYRGALEWDSDEVVDLIKENL